MFVQWGDYMHGHKHHEQLIKGVYTQFKPIMDHSPQAMYIYLDDEHLIWNKKFGELVGYKTVAEAHKKTNDFLGLFVDKKNWKAVVTAFRNAMDKGVATNAVVGWKHRSGKVVKKQVILVPICYDGHMMALHFIG